MRAKTALLQTCVPTPRLRGPSDLWRGNAEVCCAVHIQEGNTELLVGQLGYGVVLFRGSLSD